MVDNYRTVYSTDGPTECATCQKKLHKCVCASDKELLAEGDGTVRVRRETKRRGGKVVTVVTGLTMPNDQIRELLSYFRGKLGCGGTIKGSTVELQGDFAEFAIKALRERGMAVKRSGG